MPGNFRTGTSFPGTPTYGVAGTDSFSGRTDGVDVIAAEVVNSLANSVVKAQQVINDNQPMIALGDLVIGGIGGSPARLGVGTDGQILTVVSGVPAWASPSGGATAGTYTPTITWDNAVVTNSSTAYYVNNDGYVTVTGTINTTVSMSTAVLQSITLPVATSSLTVAGFIYGGNLSDSAALIASGSTLAIPTQNSGGGAGPRTFGAGAQTFFYTFTYQVV